MFRYIFKISRIRFWLYLAGPFIIGYLFGITKLSDLLSYKFFLGLLFFLIPANIFLYGVNDYFDYDTDRLNPKKKSKEQLVTEKIRKNLVIWLYGCVILFIGYALNIRIPSLIILVLFFLLSLFYSAPPLRFKSKPFIDSFSNILYFLPGVIAYIETSGNLPSWILIIGFMCWTSAMHLYSAIPDISYDRKAGLKTTAVFFGKTKSLWICFLLWLIFFLCIIQSIYSNYIPIYAIFWILGIYPLMVAFIITFRTDIEKAYWYYPYITAVVGTIISLSLIISKL